MCRIIIVDDQPSIRQVLRMMVTSIGKMEVIAEASNGEEFLTLLENNQPDVVLMDITMPRMDGKEATRKALEKYPNLKILALSSHGDEKNYYEMVDAGVMGFVIKGSEGEIICNAIKALAKGDSWFSPELLRVIVAGVSTIAMDSPLSKSETQLLECICNGLNQAEISARLNISISDLEKQNRALLTTTGCTNNASLIMYAIKNQIISI